MHCLLPSEEETAIHLTFKDGQEPLVIDAVDVDNLVIDVRTNKVPEDSSFEKEFIRLFQKAYNRKLTKMNVAQLCTIKAQIFANVKKNCYEQPKPLDSTEPNN